MSSTRLTEKEKLKLMKKLEALILAQKSPFTVYSLTMQVLGDNPSMRDYSRLSTHVRNTITHLVDVGKIQFMKETPANVPGRKKRLYKIIPSPETVSVE